MTKKTFVCLLLITTSIIANAQIKAVTESGDEVILYKNNTWKYLNDSITLSKEIPTNNFKFIKEKESSFLVKSNKINVGIWINPKKWSFKKTEKGGASEFKFTFKEGELQAMVITEKAKFPLEVLKTAAITNAKKAAPDIKVLKEEYRNINGLKVLMMQMSGTIQNIKFTYYSYYFSGKDGVTQIITYTYNDYLDQSVKEIEIFLNGFVEL